MNLTQLVSPSVALPAELVLQDGQPDLEFDFSTAYSVLFFKYLSPPYVYTIIQYSNCIYECNFQMTHTQAQ